MKPFQQLVQAKLEAQGGQEEAAKLWKSLWAAYEKGGPEQLEALVNELVDSPDSEDGEDSDEG